MLIDLTAMFGAGNEPTSVETIQKLLPNDYYNYTTGKPMNLVSNVSIKTTGKNQFNPDINLGLLSTTIGAGINEITSSDRYAYTSILNARDGLAIRFKTTDLNYFNFISVNMYNNDVLTARQYLDTFISTSDIRQYIVPANTYDKVRLILGSASTSYPPVPFKGEGMIVIGTEYADYEPYSTDTLSLPITTYFPDGMMSAGTVYDELTSTNYYKRIGVIDLGNLN